MRSAFPAAWLQAGSQAVFALSYLYPTALFSMSLVAFIVSHHLPFR
jgi:hypothetical protein